MHANSWFRSSSPISNMDSKQPKIIRRRDSVCSCGSEYSYYCLQNHFATQNIFITKVDIVIAVLIAHNCVETSGMCKRHHLTHDTMTCSYLIICCLLCFLIISLTWTECKVLNQFVTNMTSAPSSGITKALLFLYCFFKGPFLSYSLEKFYFLSGPLQ